MYIKEFELPALHICDSFKDYDNSVQFQEDEDGEIDVTIRIAGNILKATIKKKELLKKLLEKTYWGKNSI